MKNLAKLALFFSLSFAVIFLVSAGFRFLILRVEWVRTLPQRPETVLITLITAARWALSLALFGSLLFSLSFTARNRIFMPSAIICIIVLSLGFIFGISLVLKHWEFVPPAEFSGKSLGEPGLILANALSRNETAIVLLKGPAEPGGPRVVAIPGQPLIFQEQALPSTEFYLPPVPFGNETSWFLKSLAIDIRLSAEQIQRRLDNGIIPFLIYSGALVFFLSSLGFILRFSAWPLANLFLGCLAFRGILAMETFFNSPETQFTLDTFLSKKLPVSLAVPLIFCCIGLLVHTYSILVYAAKRRSHDED